MPPPRTEREGLALALIERTRDFGREQATPAIR